MTAIEPDTLSSNFLEDPNAVLEVMREDYPVVYLEATEACTTWAAVSSSGTLAI